MLFIEEVPYGVDCLCAGVEWAIKLPNLSVDEGEIALPDILRDAIGVAHGASQEGGGAMAEIG
jgi:hypothetical protein